MCRYPHGFHTTDPLVRTRGAKKSGWGNQGSFNLEGTLRIKATFMGAYWPMNTNSRPSFYPNVKATLYREADQQTSEDGVIRYKCACRGGFVYLPEKKFGKSYGGRTKGFATIGHIKQWREHIVDKVDRENYEIKINNKTYVVSAYPCLKVNDYYNDIDNLRLEADYYNSARAYQYPDEDLLYPECYIKSENGELTRVHFY